MSFLYLLESVRNPVLDVLMQAVTELGGATLFIVFGMLMFWCVDKRQGYFLLTVGLAGTFLNQFLKISCRVPRPWVRDPAFTIVESARADAAGYSFPSGHSQIAVGTYGGLALCRREKWVRIVGTVLAVLIPFSRMYLGVHTPADVLVGSSVTEHLLREWTQAGRVHLQVERIDPAELLIPAEQTKLLRDTVASLRLDSVLAAGFAVGRSVAADLIRSGKAEVNWMPCDKPDAPVRQGDVLTVRGLGKCLLEEVGGQSRKGRTAITMKRFI